MGKYGLLTAAALALHGGILSLTWHVADSEGETEHQSSDSRVEVDVVRNANQTDPEPEKTEPEPKPEPEPEPQPEPEPEPQPEPEPDKPEPPPPDDPENTGVDRETQPSTPKNDEAESAKPVDLQGVTMESTSKSSDGPAIKVGKNLDRGKMNDKYIDPDRVDEAETGEGDGKGYGSSATPGKPGQKNCQNTKPKVTDRVRVPQSKYPAKAKRQGLGGEVVAVVTVAPEGDVTDVRLVKKTGLKFDKLARKAFEKWEFKPARKDCRRVEGTVRVSHRFEVAQ